MASDFGDEAGQEPYDWMMRIGQDAGGKAMSDAAGRLAQALRNARSGIGPQAETEDAARPEWAKLDMAEFKELPECESIQAAISAKLESAGLAHSFMDGRDPSNNIILTEHYGMAMSRAAFEEIRPQPQRARHRRLWLGQDARLHRAQHHADERELLRDRPQGARPWSTSGGCSRGAGTT